MSLSGCKGILSRLAAGGPFLVALFLILCGAPQIACAGTELFVAPAGSGDCSQANPCDLQAALSAATNGDTLYLMQGTYTGTGEAVINVTGNNTFYGGWDGTTTTPVVRNSDAYPTTLDGQDTRRVITISGDIAPLIDGFTITGGKAEDGGGIHIDNSSPVIQNNVITANRTIDGGTYEDGRGGGIYVYGTGTAVIARNRIFNNTSGYGGGIYHSDAAGPLTIMENEITGNVVSSRGGGILVERASDVIQSNVISGNSAGGDGGGMLVWDGAGRIEANRFVNNTAWGGGGISLGNNATPVLTNNLLIGNSRDGLLVGSSSPAVINNTIAGSGLPDNGDGIRLSSSADCSPPYCAAGVYTNNIVVDYEVGIHGIGPVAPAMDYNDVWGNTTADYVLPEGVETGAHDIGADPLFVGGGDYHLTVSSPCLNSGSNDAPDLPATDSDGNPRIVNGIVDMGAYELQPIVYIAPDGLCDGHTPCYSRIQDGIDWEGVTFTIMAEQGAYGENIIFSEAKEIFFQGGWDSIFENASGAAVVDSMNIASGAVILDKGYLVIQRSIEAI